ncbi:FlgO family outer membrane protein [uncultured Croceitalea sp.]|uniref:FlgO family outer membrane protein n=1 Tax=uncultured Croceitalea sp. TaxID=1798908 RepID=UPI0033067EEA
MNTTKILSIFIFLSFLCDSYAQDFDTQLEKLAEGLAKRIESKGKAKIAVWGFFTENGERTALGNYLTEDFSVYLTNFGDNFEVIDRNHLNVLLKEHKLNADGYIDENTAKELGKIVAVDVVITGTYTVLNSIIKVRAKALDTETALQFAANMGNLPINDNIASYLGISVNGGNTTNRGFNTPLSSKETINNPETVDSKCSKENFGNVCFYNTTSTKIVLRAKHFRQDEGSSVNMTDIFIDPGETKCMYKIKNRTLSFYIVKWDIFQKELNGGLYKLHQDPTAKYLLDKGELKVETCTSKTYTIK